MREDRSHPSDLRSFLIKTAIVAGVVLTLMVVGALITGSVLSNTANRIGMEMDVKLSAVDDGLKGLERNFKAIADWPEEKVEKYRKRAHDIAETLKPIMEEIMVLFNNPALTELEVQLNNRKQDAARPPVEQ